MLAAATAALFGISTSLLGDNLQLALSWILIVLLILISTIDVQRRLVLDRLTFPAIAAGPVFAWLWPGIGLRSSFLGGITALAIFTAIILIHRQGMGMGDLKLATMIGLYLGWTGTLFAILTAFLLGGVVSLCVIFLGGSRKSTFAYSPVLSAGAIFVLLGGRPLLA